MPPQRADGRTSPEPRLVRTRNLAASSPCHPRPRKAKGEFRYTACTASVDLSPPPRPRRTDFLHTACAAAVSPPSRPSRVTIGSCTAPWRSSFVGAPPFGRTVASARTGRSGGIPASAVGPTAAGVDLEVVARGRQAMPRFSRVAASPMRGLIGPVGACAGGHTPRSVVGSRPPGRIGTGEPRFVAADPPPRTAGTPALTSGSTVR